MSILDRCIRLLDTYVIESYNGDVCVFFLSAMKNLKFLISYEYIIWSYIHLKILIIE